MNIIILLVAEVLKKLMSSFLAAQLRLKGNTWTFLNCPEVMPENNTWNVEYMKHFVLYKTSYG